MGDTTTLQIDPSWTSANRQPVPQPNIQTPMELAAQGATLRELMAGAGLKEQALQTARDVAALYSNPDVMGSFAGALGGGGAPGGAPGGPGGGISFPTEAFAQHPLGASTVLGGFTSLAEKMAQMREANAKAAEQMQTTQDKWMTGVGNIADGILKNGYTLPQLQQLHMNVQGLSKVGLDPNAIYGRPPDPSTDPQGYTDWLVGIRDRSLDPKARQEITTQSTMLGPNVREKTAAAAKTETETAQAPAKLELERQAAITARNKLLLDNTMIDRNGFLQQKRLDIPGMPEAGAVQTGAGATPQGGPATGADWRQGVAPGQFAGPLAPRGVSMGGPGQMFNIQNARPDQIAEVMADVQGKPSRFSQQPQMGPGAESWRQTPPGQYAGSVAGASQPAPAASGINPNQVAPSEAQKAALPALTERFKKIDDNIEVAQRIQQILPSLKTALEKAYTGPFSGSEMGKYGISVASQLPVLSSMVNPEKLANARSADALLMELVGPLAKELSSRGSNMAIGLVKQTKPGTENTLPVAMQMIKALDLDSKNIIGYGAAAHDYSQKNPNDLGLTGLKFSPEVLKPVETHSLQEVVDELRKRNLVK